MKTPRTTDCQIVLRLTHTTMEQLIGAAAQTLPVAIKGSKTIYAEGDGGDVSFRNRSIRKTFHKDEWWFSVVDVVGAISESTNPTRYWSELRKRIVEESGDNQLFAEIEQLEMLANDMKNRKTDCASTETLFRIIQSIPSKHAEPFKRWLAKVAYERTLDEQNPENAIKRAIANYELQGRDMPCIRRRIETIISRNQLTSERSPHYERPHTSALPIHPRQSRPCSRN